MSKIEIINKFYLAWVNKDIESLKDIINYEKFGIRNFFKDVMFSLNDIEKEFVKYQLLSFNITDYKESNDVMYCDVSFKYEYNNTHLDSLVTVKFIFKNKKIIKVYETHSNHKLTRVKCTVSYDGSVFSGFQKQPNIKTVQGDIEKGLRFLTKEDITIHSSGRTDKGVHALNQVFHFDTLSKINPNNFGRVLNSYLPDTIYIKSSSEAHKTFHSRYDVLSKEYMYVINYEEYDPIKRDYEWFVSDFDLDILKRELIKLIGIHDFTSFTKTEEDKEMVREILDVKIVKTNSHLYISIIGKGFLRYMVRYLIGTLVEIAKGNIDNSILDFIEMKNSSEVRWKAPSCGLFLKEVIYHE